MKRIADLGWTLATVAVVMAVMPFLACALVYDACRRRPTEYPW